MLEAINDGLRRFADFRGKSTRFQYNSFFLFYLLLNLFIQTANPNQESLNTFIWIASLLPMFACEIRRAHDVGRRGWWILVPLFPIYLMFKKSVPEAPTFQDGFNS
jgi:uncharacterized membrane protein YhaH (DUF805 family)